MTQEASSIRKLGRFVLEALGLGVCGGILGVIGIILGAKVLAGGDTIGFASLGLAIAGLIAGYPLGVIAGIVLLKMALHRRGSLWLGTIGAIVGTVLTIGLAEPLNLNVNAGLMFGLFLLAAPVFGLAGFYLKR